MYDLSVRNERTTEGVTKRSGDYIVGYAIM